MNFYKIFPYLHATGPNLNAHGLRKYRHSVSSFVCFGCWPYSTDKQHGKRMDWSPSNPADTTVLQSSKILSPGNLNNMRLVTFWWQLRQNTYLACNPCVLLAYIAGCALNLGITLPRMEPLWRNKVKSSVQKVQMSPNSKTSQWLIVTCSTGDPCAHFSSRQTSPQTILIHQLPQLEILHLSPCFTSSHICWRCLWPLCLIMKGEWRSLELCVADISPSVFFSSIWRSLHLTCFWDQNPTN